ncbi:MAG: ATP-binding protein [Deltaproteobacteria bacterium]|nr:ATP-binding protein [Deltaproteobacteria bacterium]
MSQNTPAVKSSVAHLNNVVLAAVCMESLINAASNLPRIGVLYGKAGLGKSSAACYLVNRYNAYRIECKSVWNRKTVLVEILKRMGITPGKTMPDMLDQICSQLMVSGRPLIIDEMDHLVDKGAVEIIRDIHDGGQAAVLLIGEEDIPHKLERWERVHSRVLDWKAVQPLDLDDAQLLADHYTRKVTIQPDLIIHIHKLSEGSARRIVVNLALVEEIAMRLNLHSIDLAAWNGAGQQLYTGKSPVRGGRK